MRMTRSGPRPAMRTAFLVGVCLLISAGTIVVDVGGGASVPVGHPTKLASGAPAPVNTPARRQTQSTATPHASPTAGPTGDEPYPDAPLCPDSGEAHDTSLFHALWDSERRCHYDHEHGQDPFTQEVAAAFPGFDLRELNCGHEIGTCDPTSPMENTHKHGGFKWSVTLQHSYGCAGREGVPTGVDALVVLYHGFGNYAVEFEGRTHSALALLRQCQSGTPSDYGYVFVSQHQDYGQRTGPYQGTILPYPDTPPTAYDPAREPYFSVGCFNGAPPCNRYPSYSFVIKKQPAANTTWISEPQFIDGGSELFALLFRARDTYQMLDASDLVYPFTFRWLCSQDGGLTFSPVPGCKYNNSTARVQEVAGEIPAAWDNLAGFDTDPRAGRITAEGSVTRYGELNPACTQPGFNCHPIKLVAAFVGEYGSAFGGIDAFQPVKLPERDIYFCGGHVCAAGEPGAVPSGWIGPNS